MRPASRGFGPCLFIRVRLRVYLPVDHRGALIGDARYLRVFVSIHTPPPQAKVHCAESNSSFDCNYK